MPTTQSHNGWAKQLDKYIDAQFERMVQVRRHLHAYPELSGQEVQTTRYLGDHLSESKLSVQPAPNGCGLIVDFDHGADTTGRRIAIRADIDALAIQDAKSVDYRSRVAGVMHACGHDAHTATVYGTTLGLLAASEAGVLPWPVRYRAIFQPAEETNLGALQMVEAGALKGVQALLAVHMDPSRQVGSIGVRPGALTADCDEMIIDIHGRGGHASRPHESRDPIAAAAQLINAIYLFVPRAIDSHESVVVTIGHIHGGDHYNVIPDHVKLRGTLRTFGGDMRQRTRSHIRQLARGLAEASGTVIDVEFRFGPPSVYNDKALTDLVSDCARELLGDEQVQHIVRPSMGGEDFAHYLDHVPGSMFRLGCASPPDEGPPLHSCDFDIDEQAMAVGAKVLARAVVQWSNPQSAS